MRSKLLFLFLILTATHQMVFAQAPDTLWTKVFGGGSHDNGVSVKQTSDGGYIIVGSTFSYGAGGSDVWLIKTDASGNTLWTITFVCKFFTKKSQSQA